MKKLLVLLLALIITVSLVACGGKTEDKDEDKQENLSGEQAETSDKNENSIEDNSEDTNDGTEDVENDTAVEKTDKFVVAGDETEKESTIELNYKKPASVAMGFLQALATNEYQVAISALDIDDSPFVCVDDIIFALPRSEYADMFDYADKEVYLNVNKDDINKNSDVATVKVDMMDDEDKLIDSYNIKLVLNEENKWVVRDTMFFLEDYYIVVAGDATLYINDIEVTKDFYEGETGHSGLKDMYKITAIGKARKELKLVCDNYECSTENLPTVNSKEEPFEIAKSLDGDELTEALDAVKTLWNSLYTDYCNNVAVVDLMKYFDESVDTQVYADIYSSFEAIRKGSSGYKDIDHHITIIEERSDADCFYITDEVIVMNVQYQVDWVWEFSSGYPEHGRKLSHILLIKAEDGFKIFEVSDPGLFNSVDGKYW